MRNPIEGKNVVIIGAGAGGLSAGILLSLFDYRVTLVEKNSVAGGLMRSYQRSGIDCPVGVHYVGALGPDEPLGRMFRVLGLTVDDLFYRIGGDGVIDRYLFDDFVFDLPVNLDAYEDNLRSACPTDARALDILMKNLRDIAAGMLKPSFFLNTGDPFQNMESFRPMGELLDELHASDRLRAILAVPCQLIGVELNDCPVIFHSMVLAGYLFSSWRLKDGGSRMADVFTKRFTDLGGELLTGCPVRKIQVAGRKVTGVLLADGRTLPADGVVAAIHPKALLELLDEDVLRASVRERILTLAETEGVIAVQAGVDARAHAAMDHNLYRLYCDAHGVIKDGIFCQIRPGGGAAGANLLSIISRSLYRDWLPWENTRTGCRGDAYREKKQAIASELLEKASGIFGPFKDLRLLDVFTPLTLRDYVNCPEGSCYGVLRSSRQLLKVASLNNLPLAGLCLAGQNALAPGVLGAVLGSFAAARQIAGEKRFLAEVVRQL
ncbi:MAG: NAD(P)/FAD-dependent oxidoreductase [Deltaproteobacteria bacterium]|nr:NAD(P)/FAD-dependent oxidoreductase [Deltaproteobacteria bacterium]